MVVLSLIREKPIVHDPTMSRAHCYREIAQGSSGNLGRVCRWRELCSMSTWLLELDWHRRHGQERSRLRHTCPLGLRPINSAFVLAKIRILDLVPSASTAGTQVTQHVADSNGLFLSATSRTARIACPDTPRTRLTTASRQQTMAPSYFTHFLTNIASERHREDNPFARAR